MTILQPKEVMQNVEKSHKDTALTTKEVETLFSLWKGTALTMKEVKAQFSLSKEHHYVQLLQACWIPLQAPISSQTISA